MNYRMFSAALLAVSVVAFLGGAYSGISGSTDRYLMGFEPETFWRASLLIALWAIGVRLLEDRGRGN